MTRNRWTRRELLRASTAAFAVPYLIPGHVLGQGGRAGANDTLNVAIIGLGGRARAIVNESRGVSDMRIVAVCDCFKPLCDAFIKAVGKDQKWNTYEDFRRMYDAEKLDGVMIETTTHARAWVAVHAMQAGMDAYIEKPMCLTIAEGRYMVEAARKYDCVTQIGTQQRSMPINNWASDLVKNGAIGKVKTVLAPNFVGPDRWPGGDTEPLPEGGKEGWWDIWTNQAGFRPYNRQLHRGWARWWAYDGGGRCYGVTGWGTHSYDQIQRALGTDDTGPVEVLLEEPVAVSPSGKYETPKEEIDLTQLEYLVRLAKPVDGPRARMRMRFASGTELRLHLDGDWGPGLGAIFVGEKGKIEINRNKIAGNPKELIDSPENPGPIQKPETQYHVENWVECVKSRKRANADVEIGQRATTLCYLVNIVRDVGRVGEKLRWDPQAERFTNCDEANQLLSRPRRKAYELPKLT
ncbi:MAG: Gfo/Idh/MocA family protein [Planctomycetota bacterium]